MSDFKSNITFGSANASTCNGLCRESEQCPHCQAKWARYSERVVAELVAYVYEQDTPPRQHCCECTSDLCPQYRDPRVCKACEDWQRTQY